MLARSQILNLIPHRGASFLLDHVTDWSADSIACGARSHLDLGNPLRRDGRLHTICGVEYGVQAAAVHGALLADGAPQPVGYLASLRAVEIAAPWLDDEAGAVYEIRLGTESGAVLLRGRAVIAFPKGLA